MVINIKKFNFVSSYGPGIGTVIMENILLPRTNDFDPLAKIWASIRKRIHKEYGVDIVGVFIYDDAQEKISCNFFLNCCVAKAKKDPEGYQKTFEANFEEIMNLFHGSIIYFMATKTNGYDDYYELWQHGGTKKDFQRIFNGFLKTIHMRTSTDA